MTVNQVLVRSGFLPETMGKIHELVALREANQLNTTLRLTVGLTIRRFQMAREAGANIFQQTQLSSK